MRDKINSILYKNNLDLHTGVSDEILQLISDVAIASSGVQFHIPFSQDFHTVIANELIQMGIPAEYVEQSLQKERIRQHSL